MLLAEQTSGRSGIGAQVWTVFAELSDIASGKNDRRPGFQAALPCCRQIGTVLIAANHGRITRRAHAPSQPPEDGYSIRAIDSPCG